MSYVPNPSNAAEPLDSTKAKTAAAEFRAIKQFITKLPNEVVTTSRALALTDAGRRLRHPASDPTPRIISLPTNATVTFFEGTVIPFLTELGAGSVTFAPDPGVTLVWTGDGSVGARVAPEACGGFLELIDAAADIWYISGNGVT